MRGEEFEREAGGTAGSLRVLSGLEKDIVYPEK